MEYIPIENGMGTGRYLILVPCKLYMMGKLMDGRINQGIVILKIAVVDDDFRLFGMIKPIDLLAHLSGKDYGEFRYIGFDFQ
jgi:hypothetical protein